MFFCGDCSIAGHHLITESFARNRCFFKIWVGPSASRSLVLKMKKLQRWWPKSDVTAKGRIYAANSGFHRETCQHWHLTRAFERACGPLDPEGCSLMENMPFCRFNPSLRCPNQLAAVAEFWFSADWPPYLPDLNSLDFSTHSILQPKGQATPYAKLAALHPSVAME